MRKMGFILLTILLSSSVFAKPHMDSKACKTIADACKKAGYERAENASKKFWQDCMRPVVMGKTVKDVPVDPAVVKQCRTDKIADLKKQLTEFEGVSK